MTIDEAIEERLKLIKVQEKLYEESSSDESKEIIKSATDNDRQLAEWLRELKDLREENKDWKEEYANLNKISYGFYKELKEAKRLLKAAVKDLDDIYSKLGDNCEPMPDCKECPYISSNQGCYCKWRYADEVLKLIGNE